MKKELGIFLLLVVLCLIVSVQNPQFLSTANLQNMARLIGAYGIFGNQKNFSRDKRIEW